MMGQTGEMDQATKQYGNIVYMPCNPGNGFFPDISKVKADVIYFCSPNNPTGAAATRAQLQSLVDHANKQGSIIVFDAAYAPFIRSGDVPKSIFGSTVRAPAPSRCARAAAAAQRRRAIRLRNPLSRAAARPSSDQVNLSMKAGLPASASAGRSCRRSCVRRRLVGEGRLQLRDEHVLQRLVEHRAARRDVASTKRARRDQEADRLLYGEWCAARAFGAARFAAHLAAHPAQFGRAILRRRTHPHHLTLLTSAAAMLKSTMEGLGYTTHGGTDAPYVFVDLEGKSSWDTFSELLESSQVVTIPGAGFGPGGEGFLRLSAFAPRAACEEACERRRRSPARSEREAGGARQYCQNENASEPIGEIGAAAAGHRVDSSGFIGASRGRRTRCRQRFWLPA